MIPPYRPNLKQRLWWWWTRQLDRVHIWRVKRDMAAASWRKTLEEHPELAAALRSGDRAAFRAALAEVIAEGRMDIMRIPSFHQFLGMRLEAEGYSREQIRQVLESLPPPKKAERPEN